MSPFDADCSMCAMVASKALADSGHFAESLSFRMYICGECGNKRCAKAADHTESCDRGAATIERNRLRDRRPRMTTDQMLERLHNMAEANV